MNDAHNSLPEAYLHRTMQEEFYVVAYRRKLYNSLEEMQQDLDKWMKYYNQERSHSGRYCYGKTSMETFKISYFSKAEDDEDNLPQQRDKYILTLKN